MWGEGDIMKQWINANMVELEINKTEYKWLGIRRDGGYIGDGILSGHLDWGKPDCKPTPTPTPKPPCDPLS